MTVCIHIWSIEPPNGTPIAMGACRLCGEAKSFIASFDESGFRLKTKAKTLEMLVFP